MDFAPICTRRFASWLCLSGTIALVLCSLAAQDARAQAPSASPADEMLRAYTVPGDSIGEVAQALKTKYANRSDIKIVPDAGRGQLLVMAPLAAHDEIANSLAPNRHVLKNITPLELERSLVAATHGGLRFKRNASGQVDEAELPTAGGKPVSMKLDLTGGGVDLSGEARAAQGWLDIIRSFDKRAANESARLVPVNKTEPERMQHAVELIRSIMQAQERARRQHIGEFVGMVFQPPAGQRQPIPRDPLADPQAPPGENNAMPEEAESDADSGAAPIGNVQIEIVEELNLMVIRGKKADVDKVMKFIEEIERQSTTTQPEIEILHLQHVDSEALATLLAQVYDTNFGSRQGRITYTPLVKPNALLLIGRKDAMAPLKELIEKLDRPVGPQPAIKVIPLQFLAAQTAETMLRTFFTRSPSADNVVQAGLGTRIALIADPRINALIIRASPRDIEEVELLIKQIDKEGTATSKDQVRIFKLRNSLADDLSGVLNQAITGQRSTTQAPQQQQQGGAQPTGGSSSRSRALQMIADSGARDMLESGVLADISIVSDPRGNALIVTAPPKSMPLIAELIRQLDDLPASESQIKVFTIVNGDATALATMLQQLFGQQQQQANQAAAALFGLNTGSGDSSLVPLRFSVDQRTNSIIASGSSSDLEVVRRILIRLDEGDIRERVTKVYRLQNAPAVDVSNAINQWLQGRQQLSQLETQGQAVSPFEQIERQVIVVAEPVSNSLIVSATPKYFTEVQKIVEDLDRRPPMVAIQVLIAEVTLNNTDEFGVELGVQDASLFTRGIGNIGFPFNQAGIGNNADAASLATRGNVATQGLSNFNVGRTNATQQFGGMVLTASSQSINVLVRALQASSRLQVISRPSVQTLDNQPAFVQVGARVPYVTGQTLTTAGTTSSITFQNVGVLLGVTPRTSPDGLIVMEINAEKSQLGPEATGVPISVTDAGTVRAPQILITTAQTTVSARSGQTVILGGLITKSRDANTRRVPYLGDVPVLGRLFRYDSIIEQRTELLIIMTPYVLRKDEDIEAINQRETERMSWCLSDVVAIHGDVNLGAGANPWNESVAPLIYPDDSPTGVEALPPATRNVSPRTTTTPEIYTPPPSRQEPPPPQFQPPALRPSPPQGTETRYSPPNPAGSNYGAPQTNASGPAITPIREGTVNNQPQRGTPPNLMQPPSGPMYPPPGPLPNQPQMAGPYGPPAPPLNGTPPSGPTPQQRAVVPAEYLQR